jgi:hypothetical protein
VNINNSKGEQRELKTMARGLQLVFTGSRQNCPGTIYILFQLGLYCKSLAIEGYIEVNRTWSLCQYNPAVKRAGGGG